MKKVFISGAVSVNSLIYLEEFPKPVSQTVFSKSFNETLGGTSAGKALNLNRLDFDTTLFSLIGNDHCGSIIKEYFQKEKLNFIYQTDNEGTQRHINLMNKDGERISIYVVYGTFDPEINMELLEEKIRESDYIILDIANFSRRLIPIARKHKKETWCDIHNYDGKNEYHKDFIEAAHYLFLSSDSMPDYHNFMKEQISRGKKLVVCTHGKKGSTALAPNGNFIETPIIDKYKYKDSNGAGDSFFSGFLYAYSKGYDIKKCLKMASINGGLCITSRELFYEGLSGDVLESEYLLLK